MASKRALQVSIGSRVMRNVIAGVKSNCLKLVSGVSMEAS